MPDEFNSKHPTNIERATQEWINKLTESSSSRKLLYYRDLKAGTLDLSDYDPQALNKLLADQPVLLTQLTPALETADLEKRLDTIRQSARTEQQQQSLSTLFLALGIASWTTTDNKESPAAPVLLIPIDIICDNQLQQNGEAQINPVLLQVLENKLQRSIDADTLLGALEAKEYSSLEVLFRCLTDSARQVEGFTIERRAVLGNFSFQKMSMVADLKARHQDLANHPVIAKLAGSKEQRQSCSSHSSQEDTSLEAFLVLKADSSQKKAIQAVLSGEPLTVIQGPPGTGKSQTIANLIAVLAAHGRRVLFVAQKQAALEAVQRNLQRVGLEHLLLDLSKPRTRPRVIKQFAESWDIVQRTPHAQTKPVPQQVVKKVQALRQLAERTHKQHPLTGKSIYEIQGELLCFAAEEQVSTRFSSETLKGMDSATVATIEADLREVGNTELASLFLQTSSSFWLKEASLPSQAIAQQVCETVERLLNEQWPAFNESLAALLKPTGLKGPVTLHQTGDYLTLFESVNTTLSLYTSDLFQLDLAACVQCLEPVRKGRFCKTIASFSNATFKETLSTLHGCRRAGKVSDEQLFQEVSNAVEQQRQWRALASRPGVPCQTAFQSAVVRAQLSAFMEQLAYVRPYLKHPALHTVWFEDLLSYLQRLATEPTVPAKLARVQAIARKIDSLGAGAMLTFWRNVQPEPALWIRQFRYAWLRSHLEGALNEQPLPNFFEQTTTPPLGAVDWQTVEEDIQALRRLSQPQRQEAIDRLCEAHAQKVIATMDDNQEQEESIKHEIEKPRRKPLRSFFGDTFDVLTSLRPCWMMDPLSVSQLLAQPCQFDVVIFDEASQIRVEESVPAILRGSQVVVAGDQQQLPPPGRYRSKSLLESLDSVVNSYWLRCHYRSKDDRLIAFDNQVTYDNCLTTFPSAFNQSPLHHLVVKPDPQQSKLKNQKDFETAVLQVFWQLHEQVLRPDGILVITTSKEQAKRWQPLIEAHLNSQSKYSATNFVVKHSQSVQGAEAKATCFLLDYGRTSSGDLTHQLGSLVEAGGERGFLTSTSRAQEIMWVISSFDHRELKPEKCIHPLGVERAKQYLEYIEQEAPGRTAQASEADLDRFETDVFRTLTARGLKLIPLIGKSQAKIRIAVVHPNRPDRLVLAIDTDGPHHRALLDIQDRYLLWPEQLEARGFRVHRLWSIDWYLNREPAITRVFQAFQEAVAFADASDAATTSSTPGASTGPKRKLRKKKKTRRRRPSFLTLHPDDYSDKDWQKLIQWIESDGLRRTKNDLLRKMRYELYSQQTSKNDERLLAVITQYRSSNSYADTESSASAEGTKKMFRGPIKINCHAGQPSSKKARAKSNNTSRKSASQRESLFPSKR